MKKRIIAFFALAIVTLSASIASAQGSPKIIVDERELLFDDQGPIIVEETGKTLIPLRFVLESVGASVTWNQNAKSVTVDSGDSRNGVTLTIGSDEMVMSYYPSIMQTITETKKLEQVPLLMNDRTMIPVRDVLEAIGAKVEWDEKNQIINVTSRAYTRYLRDMGVEGYEVFYPLAEGEVPFDKKPDTEITTPYEPKEALPGIAISSEDKEAKAGEEIEVLVSINNIEKIIGTPVMTIFGVTLKYDFQKLEYAGYELVKDGEVYKPAFEAIDPDFAGDSVKLALVIDASNPQKAVVENGVVAKVKFKVLSEETSEIQMTTRSHQQYGMDQILGFKVGNDTITYDDVNELYIDQTPVVIN